MDSLFAGTACAGGNTLCLNGIIRSGSLNKLTRASATRPESSNTGLIAQSAIKILGGTFFPVVDMRKLKSSRTNRSANKFFNGTLIIWCHEQFLSIWINKLKLRFKIVYVFKNKFFFFGV
jgi:hypothetical protein